VEVHEDVLRLGEHRLGDQPPNVPAQRAELSEPLGGVQHRAGVGERRLAAAQKRLVSEQRPVRAHDRLEGDPRGLEEPRERRLEARAISRAEARVEVVLQRVALRSRERAERVRAPDARDELFGLGRLREVLERAEAHRLGSGLDRRRARQQDHGHVEIHGANRAQQLDAAHPRHVDVGEDDRDALAAERFERGCAVARFDRLEPAVPDRPRQRRTHQRVVVDHEDAQLRVRLSRHERTLRVGSPPRCPSPNGESRAVDRTRVAPPATASRDRAETRSHGSADTLDGRAPSLPIREGYITRNGDRVVCTFVHEASAPRSGEIARESGGSTRFAVRVQSASSAFAKRCSIGASPAVAARERAVS